MSQESGEVETADARRKPLPQRACEECKRKKTKCDMKQPVCSLCDRIGFDCIYPTRRKPPTRQTSSAVKKSNSVSKVDSEKLSRLIELLDNDKLENLLTAHGSSISVAERLDDTVASPQGVVADSSTSPQGSGATPWLYDGQSSSNGIFAPDNFVEQPFSNLDQPQGDVMATDLTIIQNSISQSQLPPHPGFQLLENASFEEVLRNQAANVNTGYDSAMSDLFENFNQMISTPWQVPGETFSSPDSWFADGVEQSSFPLQVSNEVADHLIDLYFAKIQPFLPLFHKPSFHHRILKSNALSENRYQHLDWQAALILNGMFALAARFSTRDDFFGPNLKERCEPFVKCFQHLWDYARQTNAGDSPDLRYLQGSILVACHQLTSGPSFRAWLATGVCVRMAYDLELHTMDSNATAKMSDISPADWAKGEEKRRAWWTVFEIDTFASTVVCRPFVTDMNRMDVLLPVPDDDWFNLRPVSSAKLLSSSPSVAWKSLIGCENQCEHAWFLVSNYLMRSAGEILENHDPTEQMLENLLLALQCFTLALPRKFRLEGQNMAFDETNFGRKNWIIATHFMIGNANSFAVLLQRDEELAANGLDVDSPHGGSELPSIPPTPSSRASERCSRHTFDMYRAVRFWAPDFIPTMFPFVACALFGPAAVHVARSPQLPDIDGKDNPRFLQRHLLELVLERVAEYWTIGSMLQELLQLIDSETPVESIASTRPALARFRVLMPEFVQHAPASKSCATTGN